MKENAGVAAARARSPGSGRNDRMCAVAEGLVRGDRPEEREPVVAGGVLVAPFGLLGVVGGRGGGVAARGPARRADRVIPARVVAHVLQVRGPAAPGGGQLVAQRRDRRRVDAFLPEDLAVRPGHDLAGERCPDRAVDLGGDVRGLPGDLRDVVVRAGCGRSRSSSPAGPPSAAASGPGTGRPAGCRSFARTPGSPARSPTRAGPPSAPCRQVPRSRTRPPCRSRDPGGRPCSCTRRGSAGVPRRRAATAGSSPSARLPSN